LNVSARFNPEAFLNLIDFTITSISSAPPFFVVSWNLQISNDLDSPTLYSVTPAVPFISNFTVDTVYAVVL
jgi:hypothetical protein